MNQERLILKGQLADAKQKQRELNTRSSGLIRQMRMDLNPLTNVTDLDIDFLRQQMDELHETITLLKSLEKEIKQLDDNLNG